MSNEPKVSVERRSRLGSAESRRLRTQGKVPCNLYGLDREPVSATICAEIIKPLIVAGAHVVDLELDGAVEKVVIRDVQWDTFFRHLIHIDFLRIDPSTRVRIAVEVQLRGAVTTGVLDHHLHTIELDCPGYLIPERIPVRVHTLKIGDTITVGQLELPAGVHAIPSADTVVVRVHEPRAVDLEAVVAAGAEPEVIGRKKADEAAE